MNRHIVALGGGGFSMEPENPLLDNYIISQSPKKTPKICFIPTASGDSERYIDNFYISFKDKPCIPDHISLFHGDIEHLEPFILKQDILYVGGGNTRNLMVLWREWGLDRIIQKGYQSGNLILAGISAGSICWFEEGLTDSIPNQLNRLDCLGVLKGSNCPHFDGESKRQTVFKRKIADGEMKAGYACDDSVGIHFVNETLHKVVASLPSPKAYRFYKENDELKEEILQPFYLG